MFGFSLSPFGYREGEIGEVAFRFFHHGFVVYFLLLFQFEFGKPLVYFYGGHLAFFLEALLGRPRLRFEHQLLVHGRLGVVEGYMALVLLLEDVVRRLDLREGS